MKIRKAKPKDFGEIFRLMNELARYEKLTPPDKKAKKRLREGAFGKDPLYKILVAEHKKEIIGYAFYFYTFSSFLAKKTLYLEDLFITEPKRRFGVGKLFFNELKKIAAKNKCGRMEWAVLEWNKSAINFYNKLNAMPLNNWVYYRLVF